MLGKHSEKESRAVLSLADGVKADDEIARAV
jgi:hypothetical protein